MFWPPAFAFLLLTAWTTQEVVEVTTGSGRVKGQVIRLPSGATVAAFKGLPYAEAPLASLRFKPPLPKAPWHGVLETITFGPICLQDRERQTWDLGLHRDKEGRRSLKRITMGDYPHSEDCLTVNIFADMSAFNLGSKEPRPHLTKAANGSSPKQPRDSRPVMVYLHGGSYQMSGGRFYPGEVLAALGGVVVVTLNYRLGPFGFLSLGGSSLPGNAGLLDQELALRWVQVNIGAFGGNPDQVTIFGNSAGGASVGLHLVSPLSAGLFRRAIAQSGSAVARWAVQRHPRRQAQRLARDLDCPTEDDDALLNCMRRVSADLIVKKAGSPAALSIRFAPVVDSLFLPRDPESLVRLGQSHPVPFMTGVTKDEVSIWMSRYSNPTQVRLTKLKVKKYLKHLLADNSATDANLEALVHAVFVEYTQKKDGHSTGNPRSSGDALTLAEIITDVGLKAPGIHMAKLVSKHSSEGVYLYEFQYASLDDITIKSGEDGGDETNQNTSWVGAYHESELHFLFGLPFLDLSNAFRLEEDKQISSTLIRLWSNFAKYGNPTPEGLSVGNFTWQWFAPNQHKYAVLGLNLEMRKDYKERRTAFWNSFIPLFTEFPMGNHGLIPCDSQGGLIAMAVGLALLSVSCCSLLAFIFCRRRRYLRESLVSQQGSPTLV